MNTLPSMCVCVFMGVCMRFMSAGTHGSQKGASNVLKFPKAWTTDKLALLNAGSSLQSYELHFNPVLVSQRFCRERTVTLTSYSRETFLLAFSYDIQRETDHSAPSLHWLSLSPVLSLFENQVWDHASALTFYLLFLAIMLCWRPSLGV